MDVCLNTPRMERGVKKAIFDRASVEKRMKVASKIPRPVVVLVNIIRIYDCLT